MGLQIAESAVLVLLLERHIHIPGTGRGVIPDAGNLLHIRLVVGHLDLFHRLGGKVVQRGTLVAHKESASVHRDLVHALSLHLHGTILLHFDAGHLLEKVPQHVVLGDGVCRSIIDKGIPLHLHGSDRGRNRGCLQHLLVFLQQYPAEVLAAGEIHHLPVGQIAHHLHVDAVFPAHHIAQEGLSLGIGEGEIGDDGILGRLQIDRCERHGLSGKGVGHLHHHEEGPVTPLAGADTYSRGLPPERKRPQQEGYIKETFHQFFSG